MPPKSKINKEMIIQAAFELIRQSGVENLNARSIAQRLGCSTQPVMYCYKTMDEIKTEVYRSVDEYHSEYLTQGIEQAKNPMRVIAKNYIRFGYEQKNLFRFLFQSDSFSGQMQGLFEDERLTPILGVLQKQTGLEMNQAKQFFAAIYYPIHGIASLLANNSMEYREEEYEELLDSIFNGVLKELKEK